MVAQKKIFNINSLVTAANSGTTSKVLPSPKASLIFGPWAKTEFYAQAGFSFHSNDGRGTTLTVEPISGDNPYPNAPATPIPALIPTKGGGAGQASIADRRRGSDSAATLRGLIHDYHRLVTFAGRPETVLHLGSLVRHLFPRGYAADAPRHADPRPRL